jgi:DNA-binding PadR family transcriptional regulator
MESGVVNSFNELEYMVMAMVGDGVNSGYAMRRQMQSMRGGRWSAESGSVYRVLRRLHGSSLVIPVRKVGVPNRERTEYALTPAGEVLVSKWLMDAPAQHDLECLLDALRTRTYFLNRLDHKKRAQTVKTWILHNKKLIVQLQNETQFQKTETEAWVHANLLHLAKARQDWLRKLYVVVREAPKKEQA